MRADGSVCFYASTPTQLVVDQVGSETSAGAAIRGTVPLRLLDTRSDSQVGGWTGRTAPGQVISVDLGQVAPAGGYVNVTAISTGSPGYVTVWECDQQRPVASTINLGPSPGEAVANLTPIAAGGKLCLYTMSSTHLVVDLVAAS